MSSIRIDPKKGVNPRLTFCRRCGGDGEKLILIGANNFKTRCPSCDCMNFGSSPRDKCGSCGERMLNAKREQLGDYEKLPAQSLCKKCEAEFEEHSDIVEAGGAYFRCSAGCEGVMKSCDYVDAIRKENNLPAPAKIGIEVSAENCPNKENHK